MGRARLAAGEYRLFLHENGSNRLVDIGRKHIRETDVIRVSGRPEEMRRATTLRHLLAGK
jgi:hypothetical protein